MSRQLKPSIENNNNNKSINWL